MTVIIGCVDDKGRVWMGGDASVNSASQISTTNDAKVWRSGNVLLGAAGSFRALDLLRRIDCPDEPTEQWLRFGLTSRFSALIRELGADVSTDTHPDGFEILFAGLGSLWWCDHTFGVTRLGQYAAIGVGAPAAMGAFAVLRERERRQAATPARVLEAVAKHCPGVCGPFEIVSLG